MQTTFNINDIDLAIKKIESIGKKLIMIAGASASGKSYFAKKLAEELRKNNKTVRELSSDDYYSNTTGLKYILYGTFDHPNMIEYNKLEKNLEEYLKTGQTNKPVYSFMEKRTTHYEPIKGDFDYIIVEWIYTIEKMANNFDCTKMFVYSAQEELIFRRIIRDQERVAEPAYMIVENLGKAFPMRKIYGEPQVNKADMIVNNDYQILEKKWRRCTYHQTQKTKKELGKAIDKRYITDFIYSDNDTTNGDIILSEVYKEKDWLLDHVIITKVKQDNQNEQHTIDLKLYQPGVLIQLHTLMQTAWLTMKQSWEKIEATYIIENKRVTIKEEDGKLSIKHKYTQ